MPHTEPRRPCRHHPLPGFALGRRPRRCPAQPLPEPDCCRTLRQHRYYTRAAVSASQRGDSRNADPVRHDMPLDAAA